MPCIHYVTDDTFPKTFCGIDTNVKDVPWTDEEDDGVEPTCKNCIKMRDGGQMGAPPPQGGGKEHKKAGAEGAEKPAKGWNVLTQKQVNCLPYWSRVATLDALERRLKAVLLDARTAFGGILLEEELEDMTLMLEYMEDSNAYLDMVLSKVRGRLKEEQKREVGDEQSV